MNTALRRTIPLVASAALVSSALLAGTGAVLADKPVPEINDAQNWKCVPSGLDTRYEVRLDLSTNKGRWAFVTVTLNQEDGVAPQHFFVDPPLKLENEIGQFVEVKAPGGEMPATMTVTLTDRKGVPYAEPGSSVRSSTFCLSG